MLKWIVFVCTMTAAADAYCYLLFDILRKLLSDPVRYFFIPITAIVLVVFAALYPVLQRRRRVLARILILYAGFVAANAAYGVYLWSTAAHGTALLIVLALVAAHLYGLPLLVSIVALDLMLSRLVFPRFDRRQLQ
jgi:hypothetical protein